MFNKHVSNFEGRNKPSRVTDNTAAISLFLHSADKKPTRESPTAGPPFASGPMHRSSSEVGDGHLSNFGDIRLHQHNVDTWNLKHDMELRIKEKARRINTAGSPYIAGLVAGANSMADERVRFSEIHVEGKSHMEGCHAAIFSKGTPDAIELLSSPMQQSDISRIIESDSRKDLKQAIAINQGSFRGVQSAFDILY